MTWYKLEPWKYTRRKYKSKCEDFDLMECFWNVYTLKSFVSASVVPWWSNGIYRCVCAVAWSPKFALSIVWQADRSPDGLLDVYWVLTSGRYKTIWVGVTVVLDLSGGKHNLGSTDVEGFIANQYYIHTFPWISVSDTRLFGAEFRLHYTNSTTYPATVFFDELYSIRHGHVQWKLL